MSRFLANAQSAVNLNSRSINNRYVRMTETDYPLNTPSDVVVETTGSDTFDTVQQNDETTTKGAGTKLKRPAQLKFVTFGFVIGAGIMSALFLIHFLVTKNSDAKDREAKFVPNNKNFRNESDFIDVDRNNETTSSDPICLTKRCIETAIDIRRSMNLSANPCDNFYEFTCGRYFPENSEAGDPFEDLVKKYDRAIEDRLNLTSRPDEHPVIKYARQVFSNCLTARRDIDSGTVGRFIQGTLGIPEWPTRKMTELTDNHLSELLADLDIKFNLEPLFQLNIYRQTTKEKFQFKIAEPTFVLPLELRSGQTTRNTPQVFKTYTAYVELVMIEFGTFDPILTTTSELKQMSEEVVQFEQDLFIFANQPKNLTNYEKLTTREMDSLNGMNQTNVSPRHTMEHILKKSGHLPMNDDDSVFVFNSINFTRILSLISNTKPEIVYNYLGYRLAMEHVLVSSDLTYYYNMNPYTIRMPMLPFVSRPLCLSFVKSIFQQALSRHPDETVRQDTPTFGDAVAKNIKGIYWNIQTELIHNLPKNMKLTESRRKASTEEFKRILFCQDNWVLNDTQLEKYYDGIYPFMTSYLEQMSGLRSWQSIKFYGLYGKILTDDCDTLLEDSAAFYPLDRKINVPPRYWMEPSYSEVWPAYLKYSGLGNTIGHEMMHALFTIVPEWIDDPNTNNTTRNNGIRNKLFSNWMNEVQSQQQQQQLESSSALFTQSNSDTRFYSQQTFRNSSCIVKHYEEFHLNPKDFPYYGYLSGNNDSVPAINGVKTFGENFADIGGLQVAYSAYQQFRLQKNVMVEKGLPGLTDYSNDQLFYINYARHWCERRDPIMRTEYLIIDEHTPSEFRVLGTLRNNQDFANTWNCPAGSFMNPLEKCHIF